MIERNKLLKRHSHKKHKVRNSFGVYDAYKYIRKNNWFNIGRPITEHEFYFIIRSLNNLIVEALSQGKDIILPERMGTLEIRKYSTYVKFDKGKLKTNLPIDWNKTLKLWDIDKESFDNKTLVRREIKEMFRINYNKRLANYNNKTFYQFKPNRNLRINLSHNIKGGSVDAFKL